MDNRVSWAVTHMFQAGLLERPVRAHVKLSDVGRQVLAAHPSRVDMSVLRTFPAYLEFRGRIRSKVPTATNESNGPGGDHEVEVSLEDLTLRSQVCEQKWADQGCLMSEWIALRGSVPGGGARSVNSVHYDAAICCRNPRSGCEPRALCSRG